MRFIAATSAVIFTLWSVLAALGGQYRLAIGTGIVAGLCAFGFILAVMREEFRKTSAWLDDKD